MNWKRRLIQDMEANTIEYDDDKIREYIQIRQNCKDYENYKEEKYIAYKSAAESICGMLYPEIIRCASIMETKHIGAFTSNVSSLIIAILELVDKMDYIKPKNIKAYIYVSMFRSAKMKEEELEQMFALDVKNDFKDALNDARNMISMDDNADGEKNKTLHELIPHKDLSPTVNNEIQIALYPP